MEKLSELGDLVGVVVDAIPSPIFIVDDDVQILGFNRAASRMLAREPELIIKRRAGEVLHCVHARETPAGCGRAPFCQDCPIRNSVNRSWSGQQVVRQKARMELVQNGSTSEIYLLVTTAPFTYRNQLLVLLILEDISELMELKGLLPICASCKKIREDDQYWQSVERYFKEHFDLDFTHGICPDCVLKLYQGEHQP